MDNSKTAESKFIFDSQLFDILNISSLDNFNKSCKVFLDAQDKMSIEVERLMFEFIEQPFLPAFLTWASSLNSTDSEAKDLAILLLKEKFVPILNEKNQLLTLSEIGRTHHRNVIDDIRCRRDLSNVFRERLVDFYIKFRTWLSDITFSHLHKAYDPDEKHRTKRLIANSIFIKFLDLLDEKAQLVAKLLYFGESNTLDEVLKLQIEDVQFDNYIIKYNLLLIPYPKHVFVDIKAVIENRLHGRIFIGRKNAPLNPATIFRNFREAALKLGVVFISPLTLARRFPGSQ